MSRASLSDVFVLRSRTIANESSKHVVVEFIMKEVVGLSLNGFNHQNVVFGLAIERIDSGYRLTLEDCYGVAGTIDASDISIRLIPGKPREAS